MTDSSTENTLDQSNETGEGQSEGTRLRKERNQMKEERDTYRKEVISMRLEKLGLNSTEGLGVAVMETYTGAPSEEALAAHLAEKYKYESPTEIPTETVTQPADRIAQVADNSTPVEPEQQPDPVGVADQTMADPTTGRVEAQDAVAAKMSRYRQQRNQIQN